MLECPEKDIISKKYSIYLVRKQKKRAYYHEKARRTRKQRISMRKQEW
jgi:hypothetical protein